MLWSEKKRDRKGDGDERKKKRNRKMRKGEKKDGKKIKSLATYINSVDRSFAGRSQANRSKLTAFLADNMGDNWVGSGGKPEMTKAEETYREGLELLAKGKL